MRYKPEHKQETRDRIIAAAGRLFRSHGYKATGVDAIMAEAGLTPGGFYAHFPSKEALLQEAVWECLTESAAKVPLAAAAGDDAFASMVDRYLSGAHRDDPGAGCPLPSLAAEISRLPPGARGGFTDALKRYLDHVEPMMPGATTRTRRRRALATLSTLTGAMALARAVADDDLSDEIFESVRHALLAERRAGVKKPKVAPKKPRRR